MVSNKRGESKTPLATNKRTPQGRPQAEGVTNLRNPMFAARRALGGGATNAGNIAGTNIRGVVTPSISQNTGLVGMLKAQMMGTGGPSVAENQFRRQADEAIANTSAQIAGARLSPGMAASLVSRAGANINQKVAADSAVIRAQEQAQTRGELGSLLAEQAKINLSGQQTNADLAARIRQEQIRAAAGNKQAATGAYGQVRSAQISSLPSLLNIGFGQTGSVL